MRKILLLALLSLTLACQPVNLPTPTSTPAPLPQPTGTEAPTQPSVYLTPTPGYPERGFGPFNFPMDINPLTGLSTDPKFLDRRPVIVKVSNLPRNVRPQSGLSKADIVYEYYTEEGTTRFAAVYYSQDAEQVGSIRSARFFDEHLIRMYKGLFVFGSGDERVRERLYESEFADQLIVEWQAECPALCRPDPLTNFLMGNTSALRDYAREAGIPDDRQELEGMLFQASIPVRGQPVSQIYAWYSAVIYNRWDYDPASGRYYRYSDAGNTLNGEPETYEQLTDALTGEAIAAENLVVLFMPHLFYSVSPEMVEMQFSISGPAYAFRDGLAYELQWQRLSDDSVVFLADEASAAFPFKPGTTWFEVMGLGTKIIRNGENMRFEMRFP